MDCVGQPVNYTESLSGDVFIEEGANRFQFGRVIQKMTEDSDGI